MIRIFKAKYIQVRHQYYHTGYIESISQTLRNPISFDCCLFCSMGNDDRSHSDISCSGSGGSRSDISKGGCSGSYNRYGGGNGTGRPGTGRSDKSGSGTGRDRNSTSGSDSNSTSRIGVGSDTRSDSSSQCSGVGWSGHCHARGSVDSWHMSWRADCSV